MSNKETNKNLIKIAFVDDHILIRDALAAIVEQYENMHVVLTARHGLELIEKIQKDYLPDVLILDVAMPEMDGFATAKWLQDHYPQIRILVLTMYDTELTMIRLLKLGVKGFLKKDIHPGELRYSIETTMKNGYYYSGMATNKLVNLLKKGGSNIPLINNINLTDNEMVFLTLVSTDMTYKEIALKMKISPRTIENYRDSLFSKLNVKSRVSLAMYAIRNGIVKNGF